LIGLVAVTLVERLISGEAIEPTTPIKREYGPDGRVEDSPEGQNNDQ